MLRLRTVILRHVTRSGEHFDWLLESPDDPRGLLWTARIDQPPSRWVGVATWLMEPIARHRRRYLRYQGALSEGRGGVRRVDEGWFVPILWRPRRFEIEVDLKGFKGRVRANMIHACRWRGSVAPMPVLEPDDG